MELAEKIKELKKKVHQFEQLAEDLSDSTQSKQKKINHLKEQIQHNINKIDVMINKNNANT